MSTNHPYLKAMLAASIAGAVIIGCSIDASSLNPFASPGQAQQSDGQGDNNPTQNDSSVGSSDSHSDSSGSDDSNDSDDSNSGSEGDSGDDAGDSGSDTNDPTQQSYTATLEPVNDQDPVRNAVAAASFDIVGGNFTAKVNAAGLGAGAVGLQHIHEGSRCPTDADDTNGDGWIDAVEEAAVSGDILVPLDNDLNQQIPVVTTGPSPSPYGTPSPTPSPMPMPVSGYPTVDESGTYTYEGTASLATMLADLRADDPNPGDSVVKLDENESLNLASRVVIVHGVPPATTLPPTVRSIDGLPAYLTVPVACGEIQVSNRPSPSPSPTAAP